MTDDQDSRFVIVSKEKGLYLGNGWWSSGPEARAVNCAPTYTNAQLVNLWAAAGTLGNDSIRYAEAVEVPDKDIDMDGHRISETSAVHLGLVESQWSDKGEI